ncbi:hypothetical protein Glove_37g61 [Diversispora epigaea]|uniref:Uncharacterized protein n=1 Tax=Diversispora epigaea TaxID=1348612 RepID=A0A397JQ19_9GLOM|nr:hypothetical protein Glove_37g61 [Diversispora epigaea]
MIKTAYKCLLAQITVIRLKWYIKSAFAGNVLEMYSTGLYYDRGISVSKDVKEAFKWYLMAAENEHF